MRAESDTWDLDWKQQVERLKRRHRPGQPIPNADVDVVLKDGQRFVADSLLQDAGYLDLQTGSIIFVRDVYYEVGGALYEDTDVPSWWIEIVPVEGAFDSLPTLTNYQYAELEKQRGHRG